MRWRWIVLGSVLVGTSGLVSGVAWAKLPRCPTGGATVNFTIDNETGNTASVTLTGTQISASCSTSGLMTSYALNLTCGVGKTDCGGAATESSLESGIWNNTIQVGSQEQAKQGVFIAGSAANSLSWTAFATVITVNNTGDGASAVCPSSSGQCTLRQAIATANTSTAPALVQFDQTVFPAGTPTTITLSNTAGIHITGSNLMIDGTDLDGNPAFVGDPYGSAPAFNRIVEMPSKDSAFVFQGEGATLSGLFLQRPTPGPTPTPPRDIILFDGSQGSGLQNTVANVKIDGGGQSANGKLTGNDCVGSKNNAGSSFANANVVTNSDLEYCFDKAVKAAYNSYIKVMNSWVHQNIGGGLQATLSGHLEADHNIVEQSGYNGRVTPTPVYSAANGLSSHGSNLPTPGTPTPNSDLNTRGNITRDNTERGLTANTSAANAFLQNDFACSNGTVGIALLSGVGVTSTVAVRGGAFVYNNDGAYVDSTSWGDFGTPNDEGNNAFRGNTSYDFVNLNTTTNVDAADDQWGTNPPSIYPSGSVNDTPLQSSEDTPITISGFSVTKTRIDGVVHIEGSGFDADDPSGSCPAGNTLSNFNHCDRKNQPIAGAGNCVTVAIPNSTRIAQPRVIGVTPTDIAILLPSPTCSQATTVTVSKVKSDGVTVLKATGTLCTN